MWLGTSSIKGLSSTDTVTHLSAIVEGVSRSGGESGSAPVSSYYSYTRQGPQIVHLASSCYYTHTIHATGKTHRSYTSLSSYYSMCPHTKKYVPSTICVFSYYSMCAHTTHTKARLTDTTPHCPHTTIFVFSYCYVCALNNECFCGYFGFSGATILILYMHPQYLSVSYYYICVLILLYI